MMTNRNRNIPHADEVTAYQGVQMRDFGDWATWTLELRTRKSGHTFQTTEFVHDVDTYNDGHEDDFDRSRLNVRKHVPVEVSHQPDFGDEGYTCINFGEDLDVFISPAQARQLADRLNEVL